MTNLNALLQFYIEALEGSTYNYTRSGYISKILNALILHKTGQFANFIFSNKHALTALLRSCHCKSSATTVLALLTLTSLTGQTPMMLVAPQGFGNQQNEVVNSLVASEVIEATSANRKFYFAELISLCIDTIEDESTGELHNNLAWIVGQVLSRNLAEKNSFLLVFMDCLPKLVEKFVDNFANSVPNKLCSLFLILIEVLAKDSIQSTELLFPELTDYISRFLAVVVNFLSSTQRQPESASLTQTFSRESSPANPKLYKVLELLNVTLRLYINDESFLLKTLHQHPLHKVIFKLFSNYQFNNVLHNQVRKLLHTIIEKGSEELIDKYFADNSSFTDFLQFINDHKHLIKSGNKMVKSGYIGHTLSIINALKARNPKVMIALSKSNFIRE